MCGTVGVFNQIDLWQHRLKMTDNSDDLIGLEP